MHEASFGACEVLIQTCFILKCYKSATMIAVVAEEAVGVESSADYYNLYCPAESFTLLGWFRLTNRIWRRFAFILECSEDACIVFKIGLVEYYHYRVDYCMELSS